jgi:hypothetical protein
VTVILSEEGWSLGVLEALFGKKCAKSARNAERLACGLASQIFIHRLSLRAEESSIFLSVLEEK